MRKTKCSCSRIVATAGSLLMVASAAIAATAPATFSNRSITGPNAAAISRNIELQNKGNVGQAITGENQTPGRPDPSRLVQECVTCVDNEGEGNVTPCLTNLNHGCFSSPQLGDAAGVVPDAGHGFGAITVGTEKCGYLSRDIQPVSGAFERDVDHYIITGGIPAGGRRIVVDWQSDVDVFVFIGKIGPNPLLPCAGDVTLAGTAAAVNPCSTSALNMPPDASPASRLTYDAAPGTGYYVEIGKLGGGGAENAPTCADGNQYRLLVTLEALPLGACCNLDTGACTENINSVNCVAGSGVQIYKGDGLMCASVNCGLVTCTPGGSVVAEGETGCPPVDTDNFNIGCSVAMGTGPFSDLNCDTTVCGKTAANDGTLDTDWYEWGGDTQIRDLRVTVNAEVPMEVWIIEPPALLCDGALSGFVVQGNPGAPIVVTEAGVPAGEARWIFLRPATAVNTGIFSGIECFADYSLQFACIPPTPAACCTNNTSAMPTCLDGLTEAQCSALGTNGIYRGLVDADGDPNTPDVASTCLNIACCGNPCDAMATAEGGTSKAPVAETNCGNSGNDLVNGGCAQDPGLENFRDVACGSLICGVAEFDRSAGFRDTDWFSINVTATDTYLAALITAQFDSAVFLFDPGPIDPMSNDPAGCTAAVNLSGFGADACGLNIAGACVQPGVYYIAVAADFNEAFLCAANATYQLEVFCCDDCLTTVSCAGGSIFEPAGEVDCDGEVGPNGGNNGCARENPTLADFQTILLNQTACGTSALTTNAQTGIITRDPDAYRFNSPGGQLVYQLKSGFVADLLIFTPAGANAGCDNAALEDGFILGCPTTGMDINDVDPTPDLPAGDQIVVVAPSFFQDDFACGQLYELKISGTPPCACGRNRGDANGSCTVNGADLSVLLSQFGSSVPVDTGADFNSSGTVNGADLSVLLSNFGCQ